MMLAALPLCCTALEWSFREQSRTKDGLFYKHGVTLKSPGEQNCLCKLFLGFTFLIEVNYLLANRSRI